MGKAFRRQGRPEPRPVTLAVVGGGGSAPPPETHQRAPLGSDPTHERLIRGYFETPGDARVIQIITMRDSAIHEAFRMGVINQKQLEAADDHYEHWYGSGLAPRIPSLSGEPSVACYSYNWDYLPATDEAIYHRRQYWMAVDLMGWKCAQIVEMVVCDDLRVGVVEMGWPRAKKNLRKGLQILARG